jgi:hypothetical protein
MTATIVGIDCAAQPKKMGLAAGALQDGRLDLRSVERGSDWEATGILNGAG